jgi:hypothetical protein
MPYTPAWFRTMERISPFLADVIRYTRKRAAHEGCCALCGVQAAHEIDLLKNSHLIALRLCERCNDLHRYIFLGNRAVAA